MSFRQFFEAFQGESSKQSLLVGEIGVQGHRRALHPPRELAEGQTLVSPFPYQVTGQLSIKKPLFAIHLRATRTVRAAEANTAKETDKTTVIPGHGAVGGKADLILFRDVLVEIRDKVAALKKQGRSLPEVVAAKLGARYDAEWGNLFQNPSGFVALVYRGV